MSNWTKRIRAAVGVGLTWAVGWGFLGALGLLLFGATAGLDLGGLAGPAILGFPPLLAVLGFLGGGAFSVVLGITGRDRRLDEMSLPRFAGMGALALLLMLVTAVTLTGGIGLLFTTRGSIFLAVLALLGAGSAAGSLALARRADDRGLLDAGADVAEVGLTKEEKRELLGR